MAEYQKPVKLTVSDPETGAVLEEKILANDYCLITAGNRFLSYMNIMGTTHILYVKKEKPCPRTMMR